MKFKAKIPKNIEPIKLADEIKRGMSTKFLKGFQTFEKADKMIVKKTISKKEAIMIADRIKSGMSIKVLNDLEELKSARSKVLTVQ